jgi:hypothetical protein
MSRSEETYTQYTAVDTTQAWKEYNTVGTIQSDQAVLAMLQEVVDTIHSLEKIYGTTKSALVVRAMIADYHALSGIAFHRNLDNPPCL